MSIRVTSFCRGMLSIPLPIGAEFHPFEIRLYPNVSYDDCANASKIRTLIDDGLIQVDDLDFVGVVYDSAWNAARKLYLGTYQLWVTAAGALRIKNGTATGDLDGDSIGGVHGATHIFGGTDPIPNCEVLEGLWTCLAGDNVGDIVYESAVSTIAKANATGIATMPVVGMIISKPTAITAIVARAGEITGLAGLVPDSSYFASLVAGAMTLVAPVAPTQVVQKVGYAKTANIFVMEIEPYTIRS